MEKELVVPQRIAFSARQCPHCIAVCIARDLEKSASQVPRIEYTISKPSGYAKQVKQGVQVVICYPRLVETGLDLLDFPTIIFYETGYSLHDLGDEILTRLQ